MFEDDIGGIRIAALEVLKIQPPLSSEHLQAVILCLKDSEILVKRKTLEVLQSQPPLSPEHLQAVMLWLKDNKSHIRIAVLEVLQTQPPLAPEHFQAVMLCLNDSESSVRKETLGVFKAQPPLAPDHLRTVMMHLNDSERLVRSAALMVLKAQPPLAPEHLQAVMLSLKNKEDIRVSWVAMEVLLNQSLNMIAQYYEQSSIEQELELVSMFFTINFIQQSTFYFIHNDLYIARNHHKRQVITFSEDKKQRFLALIYNCFYEITHMRHPLTIEQEERKTSKTEVRSLSSPSNFFSVKPPFLPQSLCREILLPMPC